MIAAKPHRRLRLVFISDTHELHRKVDIPPCDILIHAGDISMFSRSTRAVRDFDAWLGELPCKHRLVTLGNHDQWYAQSAHRLRNATVLMNDALQIEGLTIWSSPVTPLQSGAFAEPSLEMRRRLYRTIPAETDIVVTHGPPFGILDQAPGSKQHEGCVALLEALRRVQPMIHCFGHVHGAHGLEEVDDINFVNAALLGLGGDIDHEPIALELPARLGHHGSRGEDT